MTVPDEVGTRLPHAVDGERLYSDGRAGRLAYYRAGTGAPALLVHSINAAASSFEMHPLFAHVAQRHTAYAVDLPGFGASERGPRDYGVRMFVDAIHDMLDVIGAAHGGGPVEGIALSLSSEFLARAARERPAAFRRLVLITPTGFRRGSSRLRGPEGSTREVPGLHAVLTFGAWRRGLFGLLTRRGTIRYFLKRTFGAEEVDEQLVHYDYLTSHQPGAEWAPLAFVSGRLFAGDIRNVYESLDHPVWVPHGTRGDFRDVSDRSWAEARGNWQFTPFDTGALPHYEQPRAFNAQLDAFLAADDAAHPRP